LGSGLKKWNRWSLVEYLAVAVRIRSGKDDEEEPARKKRGALSNVTNS
jgi:hypothetical protein